MRCPKCGYVSFDYLAQCKKCSRELADVRQMLNLPDVKPEVPFLLGSLVGESYEGGGGQGGLPLTQETDLELEGIELNEPAPLEETVDIQDLEGRGIDMREAESLDTGSTEEAEVSLEELEAGGAAEDSGEEEGFLGLELELDEESRAAEVAGEEWPELDLSAEDSSEEMELGDLSLDEPGADAGEPAAANEKELELDLSEEDLSALVRELEDQLQTEPEEKGANSEEPSAEELEKALLEMDEEE